MVLLTKEKEWEKDCCLADTNLCHEDNFLKCEKCLDLWLAKTGMRQESSV